MSPLRLLLNDDGELADLYSITFLHYKYLKTIKQNIFPAYINHMKTPTLRYKSVS